MQTARRDFCVHPREEPALRCRIAHVGRAHAGDLGDVLAGLGNQHRIGRRHQRGTGTLQRELAPGVGGVGVGQHALARERGERGRGLAFGKHLHAFAHVRIKAGWDLRRVREETQATVGFQQGVAKNKRGVRHIEAADVQQPGNRIRREYERAIRTFRGDGLTDLAALVGAVAAGEALLEQQGLLHLRGRAVMPAEIHGILCEFHQLHAMARERLVRALLPRQRVHARIESRALAGAEALAQPVGVGFVDQVAVLEELRRDLLAHLHGVAAVDEDRSAVQQHDHGARGTAEAARP